MTPEEQIRTFIAVELPEDVKDCLAQLQSQLKATLPRGIRWVRPEGIHITLKFLGSVSISLLPKIEAGMAEACRGVSPFSLRLTELGVFPSKSRPRVVWIGVGGDIGVLVSLQARIDSEMEKLGFAKETRPFTPHLTLGRVEESVPAETRKKISAAVESIKVTQNRTVEVGKLSLMRSKLMRGGAVYSRIASIDL